MMMKSEIPSLVRHALRGGLAISAVALAAAACSSSGGAPTAGSVSTGAGSGPVLGATFHGTIYVSGQVHNKPTTWHETKTFTYRDASVRNCAAAAKSGDTTDDGVFEVPTPQAPLPQDNIEITGFHGPGTYPPNVLKRDKGDTIFLTQASGTKPGKYVITTSAHGVTAGKEVLFLNSNGSGQLVYSEAHLDGKASSPAVAGLISWSCTS
jgi:hypothetical protein